MWPGADYVNERTRLIPDPENNRICSLDRATETRMPFHDMAMCIEGECAIDFSHHFI